MEEFILSKNRAKIDLKVIIVDFSSTKNLDLFTCTIAKILIANAYLKTINPENSFTPSNMINFASTYDKSRRNHEVLSKLFQLVEEKNSKTITSGVFGFSERLKIFLNDKTKHLPVFEDFLTVKKIKLMDLYGLKKSLIEDLITLTSSRGVAKTGVSLKEKNVALYRFDDLRPVTVRYNPVEGSVEPWRSRFNSDFLQLAGRVACLGESSPTQGDLSLRRCAILARASKYAESSSGEDDGLVTWKDCIELFEKIPSIKTAQDIVFFSYDPKTSIKDDPTYKKNPSYHSRFKEISKDQLITEILCHVGLMDSQSSVANASESEEDLINSGVDLVLSKVVILLKRLKIEYGISDSGSLVTISVIWSTNANHFLSGLSTESLFKKLEVKEREYKAGGKQMSLKYPLYEDFLFSDWLNNDTRAIRHRKVIGISVERSCYEEVKQELKSRLTEDQLKSVKGKIKERIRNGDFYEI